MHPLFLLNGQDNLVPHVAHHSISQKKKKRINRSSTDKKIRIYKLQGRLRLDEALAKLKESPDNPDDAMIGWSSARVRAFKAIKENPNAYYYRFNAPGEAQRNGPWTTEERYLFLQRLASVGADGNWGIFATKIPGRVGYQCSNFYRKLLDEGVVHDVNYYQDAKKKWHYKFSNVKSHRLDSRSDEFEEVEEVSEQVKNPAVSQQQQQQQQLKKKSSARKKKNPKKDCYESEEDYEAVEFEEYQDVPLASSIKNNFFFPLQEPLDDDNVQKNERNVQNPLPGFIDPITLEDVVRPAISPYGHVMGYDSWLRCLSQPEMKNTCPLTKKPLKKRELVLLTFDNIENYLHKISN